MLAVDSRNELCDRGGILVIDHERRGSAAHRRDQIPRLLDRLRPSQLGGPGRATTATRRVDVETGTGELDRDRATGAARRPRNHRDSRCLGCLCHADSLLPQPIRFSLFRSAP